MTFNGKEISAKELQILPKAYKIIGQVKKNLLKQKYDGKQEVYSKKIEIASRIQWGNNKPHFELSKEEVEKMESLKKLLVKLCECECLTILSSDITYETKKADYVDRCYETTGTYIAYLTCTFASTLSLSQDNIINNTSNNTDNNIQNKDKKKKDKSNKLDKNYGIETKKTNSLENKNFSAEKLISLLQKSYLIKDSIPAEPDSPLGRVLKRF